MDFNTLAKEVIQSESVQQRHNLVNSLAAQLESISTSADELLRTAKPAVKETQQIKAVAVAEEDVAIKSEPPIEVASAPKPEESKADLDEKLSDYYGVNQIDDAVIFVTLYPRAANVKIAGDFNNWQPEKSEMEKVGSSGIWQTKMQLHPGRYRYRLVVDGQWQKDPYNNLTEPNPFGQLNSILEVK